MAEPYRYRPERKIWRDALNRKKFKDALAGRDQVTVRAIASYFAERLRPGSASAIELRLWEVAVAYSEVTNTGPARQQVRVFVRNFIKDQSVEAALLELQAWAKPHHCLQIMLAGNAVALTCEAVVVEFAERFPLSSVSHARQVLAEHGLPLPES